MADHPPRALSVVIPLRDRSGVRLDNALRSLGWQEGVDARVEVILSDFGSRPLERRATEALADTYSAQLIYTPSAGPWNRARALNIGIRRASGHYILCTDADMVFAPNFLRTLLDAQHRLSDGALVLCRTRDLPQALQEQSWSRDDLERLVEVSDYRARLGTGACQMATRAFFERVRGFDEAYTHWGLEDTDMTYRAKQAGLVHAWVDSETTMLHQWHPSQRTRWPLRKTLNDLRFHLTKRRIVKNKATWGLAP